MYLKTLATFVVLIAINCPALSAQNSNQKLDDALNRSTRRIQQNQSWRLQYRLQEGETIRWDVEQIAKTDTAMAGFEEESSLRTRSIIAWNVLSVDSNGKMTIQDQLEKVVEWQKTGDNDPVSYDSSKDEEVPGIYQATAEKVGKPLATTTIEPSGRIVQRESHIRSMEFGMGKFTLVFPEEPLSIGTQWNTPEELQARRSDQTIKTIKTRMLYTLRKVENGIATISFRREILTPIKDPKVKSQIQQKLNQGVVIFDIAKGRITRKVVQWDEKVQGFEGDDSYLHYVGKYTMDLIPESTTTSHENPLKPRQSGERSSRYIRPRNGKPVIRK